jgi:hypothetical protein
MGMHPIPMPMPMPMTESMPMPTGKSMTMPMSHYVIYEQLAVKPDAARMTPPPPGRLSTLPDFPSSQAFFVLLDGQTPSSDCGPTCCGKTS